MKTQYYTPKIEEFHVGFDYEITNGYDWIKKTFSKEDLKSFLYEKLENAINQNFIRVKHLDKYDIESFGLFKVVNDWWHKSNTGNDWQILKIDEHKYQISYGQHEFSKTYFQGAIKNKSELKRILQQLNIL